MTPEVNITAQKYTKFKQTLDSLSEVWIRAESVSFYVVSLIISYGIKRLQFG